MNVNKVCVVAKIRNDADIVPYMLRYYYNIGVTNFYIILHKATPELIKAIKSVKLQKIIIRIFYDSDVPKLKSYGPDYIKFLTDRAQADGFRWIVATDSDEFLILKKHRSIYEFIREYDDPCRSLSLVFKWVNYYPGEDLTLPIPKRMIYRTEAFTEPNWTKAIGKFTPDMYFPQGNHYIANQEYGVIVPPLKVIEIQEDVAYYAHFPFRDKEQFLQKQKIYAERKGNWREDLPADYWENFWNESIQKQHWPGTLDNKENSMKQKKIWYGPLNPKLFEVKE